MILRIIVFIVGTVLVGGGLIVAAIDFVRRDSWSGLALLGAALGFLLLLAPLLIHRWRTTFGRAGHPPASREDVAATRRSIERLSDRNLKKSSEYEWRISQAVAEVERQVGLLAAQVDALRQAKTDLRDETTAPRVLFMTSNGAGLGHVTRMLAVADKLPEFHRSFFTFSSGVELIRSRGYDASYFPSFETGGIGRSVWKQRMAAALSSHLDRLRPDVVVFDGTYVYEPIPHACTARGIPLVWSQRGCWKPEVDRRSKQRHAAVRVSDAVIVPGDYGCPEDVNIGGDVPKFEVDPITLVGRSDVFSRDESCSSLGLDPTLKYVLVQLGSGVIGHIHNSHQAALEQVQSLGPEWRVVTTRSPISLNRAESSSKSHTIVVSHYPITQHVNLFEFGVIAGGYNAVQEAIGLGLPTVIVPNPSTKTDDQERRARYLQEAGLARMAATESDLTAGILELSDETPRLRLRNRMSNLLPPRGGEQAASAVREVLDLSRRVVKTDR